MNVVVTGVSSFVGCHLARYFASRGHRVTGTISRPRGSYRGVEAERLAKIETYIALARLNLRETNSFAPLVQRLSPKLWIHHAGYATNYASPDYDPAAGEAINVAPLDALYAALAGGNCGVIVTGTSMEYAPSTVADREDSAGEPVTPYGLSKLAETRRAAKLSEHSGVPTRVARLYIPFGRLDNPNKLMTQALAKLRAGAPIALSPCTQRRDFIGVSDVCTAYEKLADDFGRTRFDVFNVGSGEGIVLRDFLNALAKRLNAPQSLLRFGEIPMRPGEAAVSYADIDKARRLLYLNPRPLATAIDEELLQA